MRVNRLSVAVALALVCTSAAAIPPTTSPVRAATPVTGCEGDACSSVTFTFDDTKQQYHIQNTSTDRWMHVSASNLAASASACLAPSKDAYLPLKGVVGSYRADYSQQRCGEQGVGQ
jgi:hypothetical protein